MKIPVFNDIFTLSMEMFTVMRSHQCGDFFFWYVRFSFSPLNVHLNLKSKPQTSVVQ